MNKKSKKSPRKTARKIKTTSIDKTASGQKAVKQLFKDLSLTKTERESLKKKHKAVVTRTQLMAAARLVYEYDFAQAFIARQMDISLSYVSRLIKEARKNGAFKVKVIPGKTLIKRAA